MKTKLLFLTFLFAVSGLVSAQATFTSTSVTTSGSDRAAVDMNNDGLVDLVAANATSVYIKFQQPGNDGSNNNSSANFVTQTYTIAGGSYSPSWSLAAGDFNKDGLNDLVYGSSSGCQILRAVNSDSDPEPDSFVIDAISHTVFTQRTNFVDINNDGHLDVFVCDDVEPNEYFINDGSNNLTKYEGANANGVPEGLGVYPSGGNYGSVWIDYDNDRDIDMFLAKCGGSSARRTNQLFRNNGNSSFTDVASAAGLADDVQTWSSAWGDYDGDGDMDCFVGAYSGDPHKMMRNNGDGTFTDISVASGVTALSNTGIENTPHDFDNDGDVDILTNGRLLINNGSGVFTIQGSGNPPSGAVGDLDNDGYLDVFTNNIYYNNNSGKNYLKINTVGVQSNLNGIGARIEINSSGVGNQIRDVRSAEGFRYMSTLFTHFGLDTDTVVNTVTIYWPSGIVDILTNVSANQQITVVEGDTLSTQNTEREDLIVFPNPTTNILNLNASFEFNNAIYSIFDMTGRRVMNSKFSTNSIDVSELSAGNYLLRIMDAGKIMTQKFIKR